MFGYNLHQKIHISTQIYGIGPISTLATRLIKIKLPYITLLLTAQQMNKLHTNNY